MKSRRLRSAISTSGLSPCGESGLKSGGAGTRCCPRRLSPCGESGLKSVVRAADVVAAVSLPVWGEWIEISAVGFRSQQRQSLPVWGEWIEISVSTRFSGSARRLSPCGESGLKFPLPGRFAPCSRSLPVWGEWIEIAPGKRRRNISGLSPCGESGLKWGCGGRCGLLLGSLPVWGEWIEITPLLAAIRRFRVSPRVGRVD